MNFYDFYIFDCDGVLIDSNRLKTEAFKNILSGYSKDQVSKFMEYHRQNGGISRWKKLEHFLVNIVGQPDENKLNELVQKFSEESLRLLGKVELTRGTKNFLEILKKNNRPCFVVSGAKEEEVVYLLDKAGIKNNFRRILGSPVTKIENVKSFIGEFVGQKGLFIGDALADLECAEFFGLDFIFMYGHTELDQWQSLIPTKYSRIENLESFQKEVS